MELSALSMEYQRTLTSLTVPITRSLQTISVKFRIWTLFDCKSSLEPRRHPIRIWCTLLFHHTSQDGDIPLARVNMLNYINSYENTRDHLSLPSWHSGQSFILKCQEEGYQHSINDRFICKWVSRRCSIFGLVARPILLTSPSLPY